WAIDTGFQKRVNTLKDREDFLPVAPVFFVVKAYRWFTGGKNERLRAPFKLFGYDVSPGAQARNTAVPHVDGTARVQT
ncbi:carbamoyltransferase C-terminal domain-containing protein, partial [Burkholderia pseudomallei]